MMAAWTREVAVVMTNGQILNILCREARNLQMDLVEGVRERVESG